MELVINEKFGIRNSVNDGLYRFVVVSFKEATTNRNEPLLVVETELDNGEKFSMPFLLTDENSGRLSEFFVSIGVKKRGVPILYSEAKECMIGKSGHVLIKNNIPFKFLNVNDMFRIGETKK